MSISIVHLFEKSNADLKFCLSLNSDPHLTELIRNRVRDQP